MIHARATLGARAMESGAVLDVAGGGGVVASLVKTIVGAESTLIDPAATPAEAHDYAMKRLGTSFAVRRELFKSGDATHDTCACVLGYRPCEATEAIVDFARRTRKPFMLHPCCVHPVGDAKPESTDDMLDLLRAKDPAHIRRGKLPGAEGDVLFCASWGDAE